jgi:hypothetical protein
MLLKKDGVPKEVSVAGTVKWYSSLSDKDKAKLNRYLKDADTSSAHSFMSSVAAAALADENYAFAASVCEGCLNDGSTDMQRFAITEMHIEACMGTKRYDDAKRLCEHNLRTFPYVKDAILKKNGGTLPEIACRNRYFDVIVGVESGYDEAFVLLDRFLDMELISREDHAYRKQSLKIRRLQRSFDGVFTYSYKDQN